MPRARPPTSSTSCANVSPMARTCRPRHARAPSGGSWPLSPARIAETNAAGARVLLEQGGLHADVVHRPRTRWSVEAGPFVVRVTGTRFDVGWDPETQSVKVALQQGSVVVTGCGIGPEG